MTHRFFNLTTLLHCTHSKPLVKQLTTSPIREQLNVFQGFCLLAISWRSHTQLWYSVRYACTALCTNGHLLQWSNAPLRTALYFTRSNKKIYYLLTPRCRVLPEQLTGLQLVKKFPAFHGTRRFITALTSVHRLSLSWASPIQSTSHILEIYLNIIHPSTPRSPHWSLSLRFPHQEPIHSPLLTHTRHMPSPSHSSRFYHPHEKLL